MIGMPGQKNHCAPQHECYLHLPALVEGIEVFDTTRTTTRCPSEKLKLFDRNLMAVIVASLSLIADATIRISKPTPRAAAVTCCYKLVECKLCLGCLRAAHVIHALK
jgi:hypothetical protein